MWLSPSGGVRLTLLACDVHCLLDAPIPAYLAIQPLSPGPLFIHDDGSPLTRSGLVSAVRAVLLGAGVDLTCYTGHSFRIGAAMPLPRRVYRIP